jgi:hypothetical protein
VKYNLNYLTFIELIETGLPNQTVLTIRATDIETGSTVASGFAVGTLPSIYKSAIDQLKTNLVNLNIDGVILPSLKQVKNGITELSPSDPLPGSLISSDLASLTPDNILETAIAKSTTPSNIPTSETVLSKEAAKPSSNPIATNIKPARIEQPSPKTEEQTKLTSPEQTSAIAATSGNVAAIASAPAIQAQVQAPSITNTTINNNITNAKSESANNSNSVVNSKNVLNNESTSEKNNQSTVSSTNKNTSSTSESDIANMFETLISGSIPKPTDQTKVIQKYSPLSSVNKVKESTDPKLLNILKSTIESKTTSTEEDIQTKKNEAMLNTLLGISNTSDSTDINQTTVNKTNTNESVNVKSTKLVESSNIKKLLEPDKTLEKSVGKLSKDLPAAVNNLSSSVTSMNPQTSSSSSVTNEGTKIDQSSKTVINQNSGPVGLPQQSMATKESSQIPQGNDFYLQAIYSALMSGKIKVNLNYQ